MDKMQARVGLSLAAALLLGGSVARADDTILVPVQRQVVVPISSETIRPARITLVETDAGSVVVRTPAVRAAVVRPGVATSEIRETTTYTAGPGRATTRLTSTVTEVWAGIPNFKARLRVLGDHIAEALNMGLLRQGQAQSLMDEHERVARVEASLPVSEYDSGETEMVERKLNALNLSVHDAMEEHHHVATTGSLQ